MCRNEFEGEIGSFARVDHADMLSASYFLLARFFTSTDGLVG